MTEKGSQSSEAFQKKSNRKMRLQVQKYEKYLESKNDLKRPIGAFNISPGEALSTIIRALRDPKGE